MKKLLTLIKDAEVYSPSYKGKKDVLIGGGKILYVQQNIKLDTNLQVDIVDGEGYLLVPGFIDSHVHIVGGGGEGDIIPELQKLPFLK